MFHFYFFVIWAFIVWRLVFPLALHKAWKAVIGIALLALMQHHLITRIVSGNMFSPEVPFAVVALIGWGFCTGVLLFIFNVLLDAALLIWRLCGKQPSARHIPAMRAASLGAALLAAGIGVYQAAQVPQVRRVELTIDKLPGELDGVKIVQLSDLHISRFFEAAWVDAVVARTNALRPDLVLITGDLIDGSVEARAPDVAPLRSLRAPMGVIAIPGNHEYYFDEPAWRKAFSHLGMRVLANEHVDVGRPGRVLDEARTATLTVAGINDEAARAYGLPGPDLAAALHGARGDRPVILLDHRPANAAAHAREGITLQLSGHTHGGMIRGFDTIVRSANNGYVSGLYQVGGMRLYVSNGTGLWNGFPIRLGVPAEITQFVLRARTPS